MTINELCDVIRETSFDIHKYHRSGHLEKIYENALAHRLRKRGLTVEQYTMRLAQSWAIITLTSSLTIVWLSN